MSYSPRLAVGNPNFTIHPLAPCSILSITASTDQTLAYSSAAWPSANRAILVPFVLARAVTIYKLGWFNGGTVSGNVDAAIYTAAGTRVISTGSTAQSGTTAVQMVDVADTALNSNQLYYIAVAMDNGTGTLFRVALSSTVIGAGAGCLQKATSFALPDPLTGTSQMATNAYLPLVIAEGVSR